APGRTTFPYTTLFRSPARRKRIGGRAGRRRHDEPVRDELACMAPVDGDGDPHDLVRPSRIDGMQQSKLIETVKRLPVELRLQHRSEEHTSELQSRFDL